MVVRQVALKKTCLCLLCEGSISPGCAYRISWAPGGNVRQFGFYHLESCGPAMIGALREWEQSPAKTQKRQGGRSR